jgi:hypothetical protein
VLQQAQRPTRVFGCDQVRARERRARAIAQIAHVSDRSGDDVKPAR